MSNYSKIYITSTSAMADKLLFSDVTIQHYVSKPMTAFELTSINPKAEYLASAIFKRGLRDGWFTVTNEFGERIDYLEDILLADSDYGAVAPVRAASTANLVATRVGAVLTADANGAMAAMDGVTLVVGDRVLLKDQTTAVDRGIYTVTSLGSASTPFVFTRATDFDASADVIKNSVVFATEGTVAADIPYIIGYTGGSFTLNTTTPTFTTGYVAPKVAFTLGMTPPKMTTAIRDALAPTTGMVIYNTTTNKLNVYAASAWEAITSA